MNPSTAAPELVVEDDPKIARLLIDYLQANALPAYAVDNGRVAVEEIRRVPPLLVRFDLMLPGQDGIAVCREVRSFSDVPIIMPTARVDEVDRLLGLEIGADALCQQALQSARGGGARDSPASACRRSAGRARAALADRH